MLNGRPFKNKEIETPDRRRIPSVFKELEQELRDIPGEEQFHATFAREVSYFPWEDEKTLVVDLLQENPIGGRQSVDEDAKVEELIESLQGCFSLHSKDRLTNIAETIVPAVRCVKAAHRSLEENVDPQYAAGFLEFGRTCAKIEEITIKEHTEIYAEFEASRARVAEYRAMLDEACMRREKLWDDFEERINTIMKPSLDLAKELPAKTERTIAEVEKQSKKQFKTESQEQRIKDILTKLM
ncbi:hypothetical protein CYLTODRAFT_417225 [Cylindrobasidium torrendii FP15055 ss-10]|uniref:Uncharacterized protein n=1 Tax=Cylindrobasidium torrendii FP15055 ss-10 TaxID=1314674 RepID=A0A0D7BSP1_9AGAR|nr:hypothetical protein CYLTODRAFT_417225 [Cylindrobasidium torrendii FP15055 ss-10]